MTLRLFAPVRPVAALALLCALVAPGGVEGGPSASSRIMQVPGFGTVTVYAPAGQPAQVVLFLSGDGGWTLGVVPMAERLRQEGALVIGVDVRALMKGLEAAKSCGYPAGALEELSRTVQARLTLPAYLPPLVVGYSSGATLAYAAIAGAPPETFTGALSLGFCPDLELHRPLCQIRGMRATKRSKGVGYDLAPFAAMPVPWMVLHGAQDQVCALEPIRRFVAATGRATLVELPKVGHGFAVPARWEPAYVNAYRAIARTPSAVATERVRAPDVADLALVEVPATGTRITDTFAVVLSGDGGWAELDKAIAAALAARGIPVVGWSSLDYYWSPRTPERAAADLGRVVRHYTEAWQRPRVIVVGYSFGADVAPFLVNRLPDALTPQVTLLALLAPSDHASFEFHVAEWLRAGTGPEHPTRPERDRLRVPTVCISPLDEPPSACATPNPLVRREATGAGHHFGGEYLPPRRPDDPVASAFGLQSRRPCTIRTPEGRMSARHLAAVLAPLALGLSLSAQQRAPQVESIRQEELRADLFFLAGDAMRGRLTDTVENLATADYIRARFERIGLKPAAPGDSYFQTYNLMTATLGEGNALQVLGADGAARRLAHGQEFYAHRFSASGEVTAPVVFAGFGITAPRWQYDDYSGDVAGKIVLVLDHEPGERDPNSPFEGVVTSEPSAPWRKALAAQQKGAVGILFVSDVHNHPAPVNVEQATRTVWPDAPPHLKTYMLAAWADQLRIPAAQISPGLATALIAGTGQSLAALAASAETPRGRGAVALPGARVTLATSVVRHTVPDRNVVALLEGSDPMLKHEWVLVTAHFDHNGADGTQIFNGADDNGSGTVALLEIADAYALAAAAGQRPKRSVLFAAWNSEERGLLGAWAYTEAPLAPLSKIAGMLNMDMIGRNEEVQVGGGARFNGFEVQTAESNANTVNMMGFARAPDLAAVVDRANQGIGLDVKKRYDNNTSNLVRRSDQWPFLQHGVPALGFMTGLHPDYHTVYDRPEKINYAKMEKIARLIHQASWDLANAEARPKNTAQD